MKNIEKFLPDSTIQLSLNVNDIKNTNLIDFKYFNDYNIGKGGNAQIFHGKNKFSDED